MFSFTEMGKLSDTCRASANAADDMILKARKSDYAEIDRLLNLDGMKKT